MMKLVMVDDKRAGFTGNTYPHREAIKTLPGRVWDGKQKMWIIPIDSIPDAVQRFGSSLELEPQLQLLVGKELERRKRMQEIKSKKESNLQAVRGLKATLYPYQGVALEFLDTLEDGEGGILSFDMGLGKTLTSLAVAEKWFSEGIIKHCLIVCPAPLKYATWAKEIKKWTEDPSYIVVDGSRTETVTWDDGTTEKLTGRKLREVQYQQWYFGTKYIVMNYELFRLDSDTEAWEKVRELTSKEMKRIEEIRENLSDVYDDAKELAARNEFLYQTFGEEHPYTIRKHGKKLYLYERTKVESILPPINEDWLVILDECHRIKNKDAETTKQLRKYLAPAGRKVLLTGTPLENNLEELWAQVDFCRPGMLGNFYQFRNRYLELDRWGKVIEPKPYMMRELKDRLEAVMLRKTKQEALPDLPPLVVQDYWVEMTPKQAKLYAEIEAGIVETMSKQGEKDFSYLDVLAQITRLQQVCDSPALLREFTGRDDLPVESGKLNELRNIIEDLNPDANKFVLFSQFAQMTDILYDWLIKEKILKKEEIGYVKGGIKAHQIEAIQNGFQNGNIKCVLMTTAGNYGLDLSAGSYVICYDQLFNPQKMQQIYSRCHRNGVKNSVTVINLVTSGTYEERKMQILERKRELFDAMIDDDAKFIKLFGSKEDIMTLLAG